MPSTPQPGNKNFGRYELSERIAVGGMAEVYRAKMRGAAGFERTVAIKRILPGYSQDRDFVAMFIDEAKIASELSHGNICQIYDLGEVEGRYFIAMEYIEGKDVRCILDALTHGNTPGKLPPELAAYIAAEGCAGLDYAHRKTDPNGKPMGIVHRDVSPSNLLVSYEGDVKIGDFGIAKAVEKLSKTRTGTIKGKYNYLAPEAVRGLGVDHRSDIFGMGAVLYEMITGQKTFDARSEIRILELVRNGDYTPARQHNPNIPKELDRIINKALMRDRDKRYQSAAEMEYELQGFLYSLGRRTSGPELADFLRRTFHRDAPHQGIVPIPPAPVARVPSQKSAIDEEETAEFVGEPTSATPNPMADPIDDSIEEPEREIFSTENTKQSSIREERTAMIAAPPPESDARIRSLHTDVFSVPVSKHDSLSDELVSQPTVIRGTPAAETPTAVPSTDNSQMIPFAQWSQRQKIEFLIGAGLGLLWISTSLQGVL